MMRRLLALLLAAAAVVGLAWLLAGLQGTLQVEEGGLSIAAPVPLALAALVVAFGVFYVLLRVFGLFWRLPRHWRRRRDAVRREKGERATTHALVAIAAGEAQAARRHAAAARRLLGDTPQALLLAAEAGRLAKLPGEAEAAFAALARHAEAGFLGLRGLLRAAIAREDWLEAANLARRASLLRPGARWLAEERLRIAIQREDWTEALAAVGPDGPRAALAVAAAKAAKDPAEGLKLARRALGADPALVPAALVYAARLREAGREAKAQKVIRRAWCEAPHPDLAEAALKPFTEPLARMRAAQELVAGNAEHPESRYLLARTALAAGLIGEARRHAEAARALEQRRVYLLLAEIAERELGESEAGHRASREALRRAAAATPDPEWRCGDCGAVHGAWRPVCAACGAVGSLVWRGPNRPMAEVLAPALRGAAELTPPEGGGMGPGGGGVAQR